ncbi:GNAT family N-acetyltransferase [Xaviernesmea oryzae]|uniref:GNAT family N-acetyltransferase n=1 Tax=Xaviernesmea oryzae TaxID=464029 RepID=A0A1Q9AV80_9HYPH|nr:GNAT family N-acetyltransferase [Xaviernesmea oryzae]OLP59367.1 GNAT family N-acetyltransferase [Xaviernesmea oryzae]SEL62826.1 phosphinothricin acetyltransferase [Xaviernesmea oryzae]
MLIRDALDEDLPAIRAIYNDAVETTTAIWNETVVDLDNRRAWMADRIARGYPILVAVGEDGRVAGYASFGDWRAFDGYRFTVEHSVYVERSFRGTGVGETLMRALIERARGLGKHAMIGAVEAGNAASVALHAKLGFVPTGTLREVGTKFGRWLDLTFLQLTLDERGPLER